MMAGEDKNPPSSIVDHVDLMIAIARLEGKMDALNDRLGEKHQRDATTFADHEKRIRANEQARVKIMGAASALSVVTATMVAWAAKHFGSGGT